MKNKHKFIKQYSFKLRFDVLFMCCLSLVTLSMHAEEKIETDEADLKALAAAKAEFLSLNKSNKSEVVSNKIPAEIKAAVEKKLLSIIEIKKSEMSGEALKVFRSQIYYVSPQLGYISVIDGELLDLNNPGFEQVLPDYLKLIKDDFLLDSEEKVRQMANAFNKAFPYKFKKVVRPVKVNHGWIAPLGKFFEKYSGLVFTTDAKGKITLVEFVLSIDPKDYSYKLNKDKRDRKKEFLKAKLEKEVERLRAERQKEIDQQIDGTEELTEDERLRAADAVDTDRDGVSNRYDTCRSVKNPNQEDADNDGMGDACDSCPNDPDPRSANGCPKGTQAKK